MAATLRAVAARRLKWLPAIFYRFLLIQEQIMASKTDDILKRYDELNSVDGADEAEKEHTLQENAKTRALHPDRINAGTAFDWEDMEAYAKELERLDREGPGIKQK
jgi:predicted TIM-barrel fold metal-dependent hydrolase